mmetsp:Transcript_65682/g.150578  ORF Transcript_65682/g.150578 Transcript_65682/m.150578 type:complete len:281 (-) Transcript_65682:391-1233(-)
MGKCCLFCLLLDLLIQPRLENPLLFINVLLMSLKVCSHVFARLGKLLLSLSLLRFHRSDFELHASDFRIPFRHRCQFLSDLGFLHGQGFFGYLRPLLLLPNLSKPFLSLPASLSCQNIHLSRHPRSIFQNLLASLLNHGDLPPLQISDLFLNLEEFLFQLPPNALRLTDLFPQLGHLLSAFCQSAVTLTNLRIRNPYSSFRLQHTCPSGLLLFFGFFQTFYFGRLFQDRAIQSLGGEPFFGLRALHQPSLRVVCGFRLLELSGQLGHQLRGLVTLSLHVP